MASPESRAPREYVFGHDELVLKFQSRRTLQNSASFLLPLLQANTHFLDCGCGPASITASVAEHVPNATIIGVDIDAQAVAHARKAFPSLDVRQADVTALPFATASFDVVFANLTLQYIADPHGALQEMLRVCRVGGYIAISDVPAGAHELYPQHEGFQRFRQAFRAGVTAVGLDAGVVGRVPRMLRELGCLDVRVSVESSCVVERDERRAVAARWLAQLTAGTVVDSWTRNGVADADDLDEMRQAWMTLRDDDNAFLVVPSLQFVGRKACDAGAQPEADVNP